MKVSIPFVLSVALSSALFGCSAGPYGHSRVYSPLGAEESAAAHAEDLDPVMARREPDVWQRKTVSVFGLVVARDDRGPGKASLVLSMRRLEARNLCEDSSEDSCRVTVSDVEFGKLRVNVSFANAEDELGAQSIGQGSLLRVLGSLSKTVDVADGALVVDAAYYRHWPHGYYVTTAAQGLMRR